MACGVARNGCVTLGEDCGVGGATGHGGFSPQDEFRSVDVIFVPLQGDRSGILRLFSLHLSS